MTIPPQKELNEKDFISESYSKNPFPFWFWFSIVAVVSALFWGGGSWWSHRLGKEVAANPFLQVTNREISIFLWQFPEYMRINAKRKGSYLPGFQYQANKVVPYAHEADSIVEAPPEVLFLYHTWQRLISQEYPLRSIPVSEFKEFLNYAEEWQPANWPKAPSPYKQMIQDLMSGKVKENLKSLPETVLPLQVRCSFEGWKNFFKEGDAINQIKPTFEEMAEFLKKYPHYARNFWRNLIQDSYPNYLKTLTLGTFEQKSEIPTSEIAPFLRVAYFNFIQANKEL